MKSNSHPLRYFSPNQLKSVKKEDSVKSPVQSPYLRAVLSGKTRSSCSTQENDSNLAAALRYINSSR